MRGMTKDGASGAPISGGSVKDNKQNDVENENIVEESNEESVEEFSEEIEPQPFDDEDACSNQSSEEPDEEEAEGQSTDSNCDPSEVHNLSEEEAECQSEDSNYDPSEVEDLSEEEEVEPTEETFDEISHPYSDNGLIKEKEGVSRGTINNDLKMPEISGACSNTENASKQQEQSECSGKQRRSRWDTNPECEAASAQQEQPGSSGKRRVSRWDCNSEPKCESQGGESENTSKRRKTRWGADESELCTIQLPDFMKKLIEADWDPEVQELKRKLMENESLQREEVHDVKFHENLVRDRQIIIGRLFEKNSTLKTPPQDKHPKHPKLFKKLYVPVKEYPDYNFIGLIIGPRGLTLKRLMKETKTKIFLRGRDSDSKKSLTAKRSDPSSDEDLHVLIEADNQKSLDDAVRSVEKLLIPVEEGANEHKRAQLRELAELTGKLKNWTCNTCRGNSHTTAMCPFTVQPLGSSLDNQPKEGFLGDLGGAGGFTFSTPQTSGHISTPQTSGGFTFSTPQTSGHIPRQGSSTVFGINSNSQSGPGTALTVDDKSSKEVEDGRLSVRGLPPSVDDVRLRELFTCFGRIIEARVIKDPKIGCSKGYGLVKYNDPLHAALAAVHMNGYKIGGKMLLVELGGDPSTDVPSSTSPLPLYQASPMMPQRIPGPTLWPRPPVPALVPSSTSLPPRYPDSTTASRYTPSTTAWLGPPGSMLPDSTNSSNLGLSPFSVFSGRTDSSSEWLPSSHHISNASPKDFAEFPGNPDYHKAQHSSFLAPSSSSVSPQTYLTPSPRSATLPFSWPPIYPP